MEMQFLIRWNITARQLVTKNRKHEGQAGVFEIPNLILNSSSSRKRFREVKNKITILIGNLETTKQYDTWYKR